MKTKALYVVGGAGTGKTTFLSRVLEPVSIEPEISEIHSGRNKGNHLVRFLSHWASGPAGMGLYLGRLVPSNPKYAAHPGTDALDKVACPVATEWVRTALLPTWIAGEGAGLAKRPFIQALAEETDLLMIHLVAEDWVKDLRFLQRGTSQPDRFVEATVTSAANITEFAYRSGASVLGPCDSGDPLVLAGAMETARVHLGISDII